MQIQGEVVHGVELPACAHDCPVISQDIAAVTANPLSDAARADLARHAEVGRNNICRQPDMIGGAVTHVICAVYRV